MIRVDVVDIRAELPPTAVLAHFDVVYRRHSDELRTKLCPACGERVPVN